MFYTELNANINYERENLRWNGWGAVEEDFFRAKQLPEIFDLLRTELGREALSDTPSVSWEEIPVGKSKLTASALQSLAKIVGKNHVTTDPFHRIIHSVGKSYYDVLRLTRNKLKTFADAVIYPRTEKEIQSILSFCEKSNIALIPFGGGSSVVGGVEALKTRGQKAVLSMDLFRMDSIVSLDEENHLATFQCGIYGPKLEYALNERGYTLGHFPQSFEYSTAGGWVAARSAGQQSNRYGKIEEMVERIRLLTPKGVLESLPLPASAMGPSTREIISGSEGLLGIITEITFKIHKLPESRKYSGILFKNFSDGKKFIREVVQAGIETSMLRLSDPNETRLYQTLGSIGKAAWKISLQNIVLKLLGFDNEMCALIVGLDGDKSDVNNRFSRIQKIARKYGAMNLGEGAGKNWIHSRFNMPYLRNHVMEKGIGIDTMETSTHYSDVETLHQKTLDSVKGIVPESLSMCHISHSYEDGACLYFTFIFPIDEKDPVKQWHSIKKKVTDAIVSNGGAVSHHHGIGADHKIWYEKASGKLLLEGLKSLKKTWDPKGILNPEKLFY